MIATNVIIFPMAQQPLVGQGLLLIEASRSHSFRHITLGRTPLDEWSARRRDLYLTTHNTHSQETDIHTPGGIRTRNPNKRAAADPHLRPRGPKVTIVTVNNSNMRISINQSNIVTAESNKNNILIWWAIRLKLAHLGSDIYNSWIFTACVHCGWIL
jgi:hypothetical protein